MGLGSAAPSADRWSDLEVVAAELLVQLAARGGEVVLTGFDATAGGNPPGASGGVVAELGQQGPVRLVHHEHPHRPAHRLDLDGDRHLGHEHVGFTAG